MTKFTRSRVVTLQLFAIVFAVFCAGCGSNQSTQTNQKKRSQASDSIESKASSDIAEEGFETAKEALVAFYTSINSGDVATANCSVLFKTSDYRDQFIRYNMAPAEGMRELIKASQETFDHEVQLPPTPGELLIIKTDSIPIDLTNETNATWTHAPGRTLSITKTDQGWKVDMRQIEENLPLSAYAGGERVGSIFKTLAKEIREQQITTSEDLQERMATLLSAQN